MPDNILEPSLSSYQNNIYSQSGEDGIIEEILNRINRKAELSGWCVESGAWDGIYLYNTHNLIKNKNYKAVLIEGDPDKHKELCKNIPSTSPRLEGKSTSLASFVCSSPRSTPLDINKPLSLEKI